uniref:Reducing polyketide synthase n=1 Tax=Dolichousnea longissima TaxID=281306 RepID=G0YSV9_9LECA|nr:reducing polyketide synthase [Dolichousnea longissima]AEJ54469.1 reducing polyketide synthase [Dolichousnea longissima]
MPIALGNGHACPTVGGAVDEEWSSQNAPEEGSMQIAIVGMACRLPDHVSSLEAFWNLCLKARSTWSEVPKDRFSQEIFYHPNPDRTNCWYSKGGHFLSEDVSSFDAHFFSITAQEAKAMDPRQRLLMECAYEALENVGVFVGGSQSDYSKLMMKDTETMPAFLETGNQEAILSARLSYFFNLRGPCFTADTACSSSLTAFHLACQSIRTGESKQAIVGGSHLNLLPDLLIAKSNIRLLSPEGKSFAFDDRCDGYGPGEGTAVAILKPLRDAIRDGDPIRAVIRNTGVNQDGRTNGITMPSEEAQAALARATYENVGLDPTDTTYVEAHGTGTAAGDPIETRVIEAVIAKNRSTENPLYVGSVKSNIGHLEGASGIVAIIKAAMMLERGIILPNSGFVKANPNIPSLGKSLVVATQPLPWPETPVRRASVSNFGFGGSNAHVVLEESPCIRRRRRNRLSNGDSNGAQEHANKVEHHTNEILNIELSAIVFEAPPKLFVLAAYDKTSLDQQASRLKAYLSSRLEDENDSFLSDLAFTLGQRRSLLPWKATYIADSLTSLISKLETPDLPPLRSTKVPRVGFVFTGQGAQWHGMGRELLGSNPVFASAIDAAANAILKIGASYNLRDEILKDADLSRLGQASVSQPACTAIQIALVLMLRSWGVRPATVTGHSSGEIAAAFAADALSLQSCMAIAFHRGEAAARLQKEHPEIKGGMLALGVSEGVATSLINDLGLAGSVVVACINSPSSITVSGDVNGIDRLQSEAAHRALFSRRLHVDVAYHSHHLKWISDSYRSALKGIRPAQSAGVQFVSSLTGVPISTLVLGPTYWVSNLVSQVKFLPAIEEVHSRSKVDILVEIGPHSALAGPVQEILDMELRSPQKTEYLPTLKRNANALQSALQLASALLVKGCAIDLSAVNHIRGKKPAVLVDLPTYPWNHEHSYWHETRLSYNHRHRKFGRSDILGVEAVDSNDIEPRWRNLIELDNLPWLRDHKVQSDVVCPMTFFLTMAMEAVHQRAVTKGILFSKYVLREVSVGQALVLPESSQVETVLNLRPLGESTRASSDIWHEFIIFSWKQETGWMEHCRGQIAVQLDKQSNPVEGSRSHETGRALTAERIARTAEASADGVECEKIYETFTSMGLDFGPSFHNLVECRIGKSSVCGRIYGSGVSKSLVEQTIESIFAMRTDDDRGAPLISVHGFTSTILSNKAVGPDATGTTYPCWKMEWQPYPDFPGSSDKHVNGHTNGLANGHTNGHTNGYTDGHTNGHTDCHTDGHTNGAPAPPENHESSAEVVVVCSKTSTRVSPGRIQDILEPTSTKRATVVSLSAIRTMDLSNSICIFLDELDSPILGDLSSEDFDAVQRLCSAKGLLWVLQDANLETATPNANLLPGMIRTIRNENNGILPIILDLDAKDPLPADATSDLICKVFKASWGTEASTRDMEREYMERHGQVFVPRVVEDPDATRWAVRQDGKTELELQSFDQIDRPLSLTMESPGLLDTFYFESDESATKSLKDDHMEIKIEATGVNFRDIMYAVGQISSEHFGGECSGTIAAMGRSVSGFQIGDRVCALSDGGYGTVARCSSHLVAKIPDSVSFVSAAAIPVIFSTAYYGLVNIARLSPGETILIHAAAGGVGQAAIRLCQWIGAEIFVTVGSAEKKKYLMGTYNIPEDHIFNSRESSFERSVKHRTAGNGVDVVLNSLAGEMLKASLDCLAPFGRFIEIGKKDLMVNTRVEMSKFANNITYATVDLLLLQAKRPQMTGKVLSEVTGLVFNGQMENVATINAFPVSQIEAAFRLMQSGKSIGKIIVEPREGDQVKAVAPKLGQSSLRRDASYLITGGTGGHRRTQCDISDRSSVEELAGKCSTLMPPIKGVIHGSAIFKNVLFETSTHSDYTAVLGPKVSGAWNLHHLFPNLDFFLLLGSLASILGNHGQSAYGATSTFLNAFAQYRIANNLPAATLNLGAIRGAGYFAPDNDDGGSRVGHVDRHLGVQWLEEDEVCAFVKAAIRAQTAEPRHHYQWITGLRPRTDLKDEPFWLSDSKFSALRPTWQLARSQFSSPSHSQPAQTGGASSSSTSSLPHLLTQSPTFASAQNLIYTTLAQKIAEVLMKPSADDIDGTLPMARLGLDSLVAVEVRNWIARVVGVKVSMFDLIAGNSLEGLAGVVAGKLRGGNMTD